MKRFIKKRELRKTFNRLPDDPDEQDQDPRNSKNCDPRMKLVSSIPTQTATASRWKDRREASERESSYSTMVSTQSSKSTNILADAPKRFVETENKSTPSTPRTKEKEQTSNIGPTHSTDRGSSHSHSMKKSPRTKSNPPAVSPNIPKPWPAGIPRLSEGLSPFTYPTEERSSFRSQSQSSCSGSSCSSFDPSDVVTNDSFLSKWQVQDARLNPIPPLHPPIPPCCMVYVGDTSATPSMVAYRISECLRKRSIVVEYDSETVTPTATCLNQEGVLFVINLYRGGNRHNSGSVSLSEDSRRNGVAKVDFSHGIIVECMRIRGDVISFHRDCRAILSCARGDSDGLDDLRSSKVALLHSPLGFGSQKARARQAVGRVVYEGQDPIELEKDEIPRLLDVWTLNRFSSDEAIVAKNVQAKTMDVAFQALGNALRNLDLDGLDSKLWGMESLVMLTDVPSCGIERAYLASLTVLGLPSHRWGEISVTGKTATRTFHILSRIHDKVLSFAKGKTTPQVTTPTHLLAESDQHDNNDYEKDKADSDDMEQDCGVVNEYNIHLRRSALHVLSNALENVICHCDDFPLLPRPSCDDMTTIEFLEKLGEDLLGASRPPMMSLGSAHESTYAAKILRLISSYSNRGYTLVNEGVVGNPSRSINDLLDRARIAGSICHRSLELEAQMAQSSLDGFDLDLSATA